MVNEKIFVAEQSYKSFSWHSNNSGLNAQYLGRESDEIIKYIFKNKKFLMALIKKIFKEKMAEDPIDVICWGKPCADTYDKAVQKYKNSSQQERQNQLCRCYKKLKKNKDFPTAIAIILFLDHITADEIIIDLPNTLPQVDYSDYHNSKQVQILKRYFNFYYHYVRRYMSRPRMPENIHELDLESVITYFQITEENILYIFKEKKNIQECIKTGTTEDMINLTLTKILSNVNRDLIRLHKFLRRHWKLIPHKQEYSKRLIFIYIHCIDILINENKLKKLSALINYEFADNPYILDEKLQEVIENEISLKENQNGCNVTIKEDWKSCTTVNTKNVKNYDDFF